jgi:hypothetical protein
MVSTRKNNIPVPCPHSGCKEKFHPKGTTFCPYTGKPIPNNKSDNVSREREKVEESKRKRIQFDFGIIGKVFSWSYNLILFVAGAFGVVLFAPDLVIGFSGLIILECIYLLFASSIKGFQKYIDKEK